MERSRAADAARARTCNSPRSRHSRNPFLAMRCGSERGQLRNAYMRRRDQCGVWLASTRLLRAGCQCNGSDCRARTAAGSRPDHKSHRPDFPARRNQLLGLGHSDATVSCYEKHAWSSFIPGMTEGRPRRHVSEIEFRRHAGTDRRFDAHPCFRIPR